MLWSVRESWFTKPMYRLVISLWKKDASLIDYNLLKQFVVTDKTRETLFINPNDLLYLYAHPNPASNWQTAIKVLERQFKQRELYRKLKDIEGKVYSEDPEAIEVELMSYFKGLEREEGSSKKITDVDDDVPDEIIWIDPMLRKEFNDIVPLKRTIITLAGDSGHHKSNQGIDALLCYLDSNKNGKVVYFSKEMDYKETRARVFANRLGIPLKDILFNKVSLRDCAKRIEDKFPHIAERFIIVGPEEFNSNEEIGKILIQHSPDMWALDYLQYYALSQGDSQDQNRNVIKSIAFAKTISQISNSFGVILSMIRKKDEKRVSVFPRIDDIEWAGLTKQLSHSVGMVFWPFKHDNRCDQDWYVISWQKVRNGALFAETAKVEPGICRFTYPYPVATTVSQQKKYESYLRM